MEADRHKCRARRMLKKASVCGPRLLDGFYVLLGTVFFFAPLCGVRSKIVQFFLGGAVYHENMVVVMNLIVEGLRSHKGIFDESGFG